ncbi:MAG TPA: hypothetical protein VK142_02165 [Bacillota bacterium]|nr:hypothetical protein [Bacillota bacterium]
MKYIDLQAVIFVGMTLIHDYWIYWGLPRIEYWETYNRCTSDVEDDDNKAA